jgi:ABC-type sulfate/molybdate transport systems ATPase subunit
VERNVAYPLEVRGRLDARARSRELLERFGLTALAHRHPSRLSGGELQRVALARALAAEPELVLWDEPWQALDVEARHELGLVFEELRETERVPVVVVTHDPGLAFSVADTFLVLGAGEVKLRGDAAALLSRPSDAFTARFVGFENVYDPESLDDGAPGSLTHWLAERAGAEGVAFARPIVAPGASPSGAWTGVVLRVHPTPEGLSITVRVDALLVALRLPSPLATPPPPVGSSVQFDIEEKSVYPLGESEPDGPRSLP